MNARNGNSPSHRVMQAERHQSRGLRHVRKGDYRKAIREFDKAIHLNPNYSEAYYNKGTIYSYKGEYSRAIENFNAALGLDPQLHQSILQQRYCLP